MLCLVQDSVRIKQPSPYQAIGNGQLQKSKPNFQIGQYFIFDGADKFHLNRPQFIFKRTKSTEHTFLSEDYQKWFPYTESAGKK